MKVLTRLWNQIKGLFTSEEDSRPIRLPLLPREDTRLQVNPETLTNEVPIASGELPCRRPVSPDLAIVPPVPRSAPHPLPLSPPSVPEKEMAWVAPVQPPRIHLESLPSQPLRPKRVRLEPKRPDALPDLRELVHFGKSRRNLFEESLLTTLTLAETDVPSSRYGKSLNISGHSRWVAAHTRLCSREQYRETQLGHQLSDWIASGQDEQVLWRFAYSSRRVDLPKIEAYLGQTGWMEWMCIEVQPSPACPPSRHWTLMAYTDDGEMLGHPFTNSLALLAAEVCPLTANAFRQPKMDLERAAVVDSYVQTRFWDEALGELDDWRDRERFRLEKTLKRLKQDKTLAPQTSSKRQMATQQTFLAQMDAIDRQHEDLLNAMERPAQVAYDVGPKVMLRWELM